MSTAAAEPRGHTRITRHALERVAAAVAAEALQVDRGDVTVELTDSAGALEVRIRSAIPVVSIARALEDPGSVDRDGGDVLQRSAAARARIRQRVSELTGYEVDRADLRLLRPQVRREARVR